MEGFIISEQLGNPEFIKQFDSDMGTWMAEGKLMYSENIVEGIENAPSVFVNMLKGANTGKQVVKIKSERKNILFITTSHDDMGITGKKTGVWISEIAHPYNYLSKYYNITIASPKGGVMPIDPGSMEAHKDDPDVISFLSNPQVKNILSSVKP